MKKLLSGAALAVLFASPAFAADMIMSPEPAPAPVVAAPSFDWTGFYIGGQLGYGWASPDPGEDDDSFMGGGHIGYNYDLGNWVVGVEGSYDFANQNFGTGVGVDGLAHGNLRVGADLGRTLLYGTGGIAYVMGDSSDNEWGYDIGAGIDYAATDHVIVGAQYTFNSFSDVDGSTDIDIHEITARIGYKF